MFQGRRLRHGDWLGAQRNGDGRCARCPPGWGVERRCGAGRDTACSPCRPGESFAAHHSARATCLLCARCGPGLFAAHACTPTRDTVCAACYPPPPRHGRNDDYRRRCRCADAADGLQPEVDPVDLMMSDAPVKDGAQARRPLGGHADAEDSTFEDVAASRRRTHPHRVLADGPRAHSQGRAGADRGLGQDDAGLAGHASHRPALASYGLSQPALLGARSKSDMARSMLADPSQGQGGPMGPWVSLAGRPAPSRLPHALLGALLADDAAKDTENQEYSLLHEGRQGAGPVYAILTDDGPVRAAPVAAPRTPHPTRPPPPRHPVRLSSPISWGWGWGRSSAPSVNTRQPHGEPDRTKP